MTEKEEKIMLKWVDDNGQYRPIESEADMNEGIFLELVQENDTWKFFYIKGASLISRRTAIRAANGISKTGYEDMPENLKKSQRTWYKGEYKEY